MSIAKWKVLGEKVLARLLDATEVNVFRWRGLIVGPGQAAVIIKDGAVQDTITEERCKLGNWTETIKQWFGMGKDYQVLLVSTVPFDVPFSVNVLTLDHEIVPGEGVIRCSVVTDNAGSLMALLGGRRTLDTVDLLERIKPELQARVFEPTMGGARHDEIRGNINLLRQLEATARAEVQRLLTAWGLRLDSLTVTWGLTEQERMVIARKAQQLEEEEKEFNQTRELRELERIYGLRQLAQQLAQEERKRAQSGDIEIEGMLVDAALSVEDKKNAQQLRTAELAAEIAQLDTDIQLAALALEREKDRIALDRKKEEIALLQDQQGFEQRQEALEFEMFQNAEREKTRMEQEHQLALVRQQQEVVRLQYDAQLQQMAVQAGMMERLTGQALAAGVMDSAAMQKLFEEQTKLRALDRGEGVAGAVFGAEAAKHSAETMKEAEDRERRHQYETTRLSSDMMEASKQQAPPTLVSGIGPVMPQQPSVNVVNVQPPVADQQSTRGTSYDASCPHCHARVKSTWKACPSCGNLLVKGTKCVSCGKQLEPGWKVCPSCKTPCGKG
ncbi:MAG: zinc ribbon domain-containing protein [Chloroflexi bacterium]|nr:zinc ribbon domain-containing protein [Chloroflexota bacterium]